MRTERVRFLNLVALVTLSAGSGLLLRGPTAWIGALAVAATAAVAVLLYLSDLEPRGVPLESLLTPAVAAFVGTGAVHLAGLGPWTLPALGAAAGLFAAALTLETRLLGPADAARQRHESQLAPLILALAFAAFAVVAGLAGAEVPAPALGEAAADPAAALPVIAFADGVLALLLGYRVAAARSATVLDAAWAAGTFAIVVGIAGALLRAVGLPRLVGPAVLAAIFYLWHAYRSASAGERRSRRWLWEYLALGAVAALVVAWNLLIR